MKKTVVIDVVGLSERLIGEHTPFLTKWLSNKPKSVIQPLLPAVTCSVQASYLTGKYPEEHGIVGNGWYFKDECEIKFWRQSNRLVEAEKIWETAKKRNSEFTCANMFWWFNMYSTADYSVTPRPMYPADGRKIPDCYSHPMELRDVLQQKLGTFPLFEFWGPRTTIRSSQWIADASMIVDDLHNPTLTLIYLPHLDYNLQRYGNDFSIISKDLNEIDKVCKDLIEFYERKNAEILILSEYGITDVSKSIDINRILRANNLITVKVEMGRELLDAGASKAFAVADHQIAHVYVNDKSNLANVRSILEKIKGIERVLDKEEQKEFHLNHDRSGDFIVIADKDSWFTYYYWNDDSKAPDYANTVDIHRKPGYDPAELFTDPEIKLLTLKVAWKLVKKKMGFRTLLNIIPIKADQVKGSHGRIPEDKKDWPVLLGSKSNQIIAPTEVYNLILDTIFKREA